MVVTRRRGRHRREVGLVDMAESNPVEEPEWERVDRGEWDEPTEYTVMLGDEGTNRLKVRLTYMLDGFTLVDFAVIQQTQYRGEWTSVIEADCIHGDDVHVHRCGRRAGGRIDDPDVLMEFTSDDDVPKGYRMAYDLINGQWADWRRRWDDA